MATSRFVDNSAQNRTKVLIIPVSNASHTNDTFITNGSTNQRTANFARPNQPTKINQVNDSFTTTNKSSISKTQSNALQTTPNASNNPVVNNTGSAMKKGTDEVKKSPRLKRPKQVTLDPEFERKFSLDSLKDLDARMTFDKEYFLSLPSLLRFVAIILTIALIICFALGKYIHPDSEFLLFMASFGLAMLVVIHVCHIIGMPRACYRKLPTSLVTVLLIFHLVWSALYIYGTVTSIRIILCDSCRRKKGSFIAASAISCVLILVHLVLALLGILRLRWSISVTRQRHRDQSPSTAKGISVVTNVGALPVVAKGRIDEK